MTIPEPGASAEAVKLLAFKPLIRNGLTVSQTGELLAAIDTLTAANARLAAEVEGLTKRDAVRKNLVETLYADCARLEARHEPLLIQLRTAETAAVGLLKDLQKADSVIAFGEPDQTTAATEYMTWKDEAIERNRMAALASAAPPDAPQYVSDSLGNPVRVAPPAAQERE